MATIIAGMFETLAKANLAVEELHRERFNSEDVSVFHINAPGQHATYPIGGDVDEDRGAREGDKTAVKGAAAGAAVGGTAGMAAGPVGAAVGAAVGAYTGSLVGAVQGLGKDQDRERPAGVMVAVNTGEGENQGKAIQVLRDRGARGVERAEGQWRNGDWVDFDPVRRPSYVE